ncbi:ligase-associated DNA damage response endonuclease PdeM [Pseudomonas sp. HR96]|uniref:ligase-associated DNA damage response endonuclease PdeM n=1 Tax=Pseudomonas sp. HR96 TaxID=1027966 RepID=UPI002A75B8C2|nr:ligase-associated DNA damage response endonuclease PdeM [Pseudomonas sp. HR96]WPO99031.1 ligase-associated DNA damage response endonuclease PdeM [Pseudomonas sp. HR96]
MNAYHVVYVQGIELWLLADKAIYWPEHKALLVADAHFGKAAAYRKLGQPVPHGTTASNLLALDRMLSGYETEWLIFLGDFLHAPGSHAPTTLAALQAWRERYPALRITLIRGNHDRNAGDPPEQLAFEVVAEPLLLGPLALQHEPDPHPTAHVLAGHVHPVFHLYGRGRQRLRLPCFHLGERVSLLPAFGAFTGGYQVDGSLGERIYVVGDERVWPVTAARSAKGSRASAENAE